MVNNRALLQAELLTVKRRIKLLMNFKNYGDILGESKEADRLHLAELQVKQKQLISAIKAKAVEPTL